MSTAHAGEILVSETAWGLAEPSGFAFDDRGVQTLKGLEGERRLHAYVADAASGEPHQARHLERRANRAPSARLEEKRTLLIVEASTS
jgi:hypothetical protein